MKRLLPKPLAWIALISLAGAVGGVLIWRGTSRWRPEDRVYRIGWDVDPPFQAVIARRSHGFTGAGGPNALPPPVGDVVKGALQFDPSLFLCVLSDGLPGQSFKNSAQKILYNSIRLRCCRRPECRPGL